jgi:5-methylcytosine-specific restriction protein A
MREDWNRAEIEAVGNAYLWMLGEQIAGRPYVKADAVKHLRYGALHRRTAGSVERKLSNITAILREAGAPTVRGYRAQSHVQAALRSHMLKLAQRRGLV